jgi:predicted ATPase
MSLDKLLDMIDYSNIHRYEGFKLISLELKNNILMGKNDLFYNFIEPDDNQKEIYTTVLIGANGTGKSNLFRIIIELFKDLYDLKIGKVSTCSVSGQFSLIYSIHGDVFEYRNSRKRREPISNSKIDFDVVYRTSEKKPTYLFRNNELIDFKDAQIPMNIVAASIMLTDKYPFFRGSLDQYGEKIDAFPNYKYLGVRNTAQGTSTRAYVRRTVEHIVEMKDSYGFRDALKKATGFLEADEVIEIVYVTKNTTLFFEGDCNSTSFHRFFDSMRLRYKETNKKPPFSLDHYNKIIENTGLINELCEFCNKLYENKRLIDNSRLSKKFTYNIVDEDFYYLLKEEYVLIEHLRLLGLVHVPEIQISRGDKYSLQESSSGEYHFLSTVIGLLATVRINSLVLIDEPEISLHPNWQMKYLSFLRELFAHEEYATSHILIATHSHFLISDLKGDSSKIIGLKRDKGKIQTVDLPMNMDTYGWSADDVLYRVFGVRTTRNHFMEIDLRELLHSISEQKGNKAELEVIVKRLEKVKLNREDPLILILKKAKEYIEKL